VETKSEIIDASGGVPDGVTEGGVTVDETLCTGIKAIKDREKTLSSPGVC